jgi:hypothetical protein
MGTVIYEASPLQTFLGSIGTALLLIVLGFVGVGVAVFQSRQKRSTRIITGVVGVFLIVVSCVLAIFTFFSFSSGTRTVAVNLDNKTVANQTCGENGESTCTNYVLSATSGANSYDFDVPQSAYDSVQLNVCYQITYYPNKGLFSDSGSYQQINNIEKIVVADPSTCQ